MKKSFPVHIEGCIYYFDEDAYERLNLYYDNLRQTFKSDDEKEIVNDIESRVAELLASEYCTSPNHIVTIRQIDEIITRVGQPEELVDKDVEGTSGTETERESALPPPYNGVQEKEDEVRVTKRLYRDMQDKVIGGVVSGLAHYWGVNVTPLRIALVLLTILTTFWPLVVLYILAWLIIPAAETPRQILEMNGSPVTVGSVGRTTILGTSDNASTCSDAGFWHSFGRVLGVTAMSFIGFTGLLVTIGMIVVLILLVSGAITFAGWGSLALVPNHVFPELSIVALITGSLAVLLPSIGAVWAACCVLFKAQGASKTTIIILAVIEIILIITTICLCDWMSNREGIPLSIMF